MSNETYIRTGMTNGCCWSVDVFYWAKSGVITSFGPDKLDVRKSA